MRNLRRAGVKACAAQIFARILEFFTDMIDNWDKN